MCANTCHQRRLPGSVRPSYPSVLSNPFDTNTSLAQHSELFPPVGVTNSPFDIGATQPRHDESALISHSHEVPHVNGLSVRPNRQESLWSGDLLPCIPHTVTTGGYQAGENWNVPNGDGHSLTLQESWTDERVAMDLSREIFSDASDSWRFFSSSTVSHHSLQPYTSNTAAVPVSTLSRSSWLPCEGTATSQGRYSDAKTGLPAGLDHGTQVMEGYQSTALDTLITPGSSAADIAGRSIASPNIYGDIQAAEPPGATFPTSAHLLSDNSIVLNSCWDGVYSNNFDCGGQLGEMDGRMPTNASDASFQAILDTIDLSRIDPFAVDGGSDERSGSAHPIAQRRDILSSDVPEGHHLESQATSIHDSAMGNSLIADGGTDLSSGRRPHLTHSKGGCHIARQTLSSSGPPSVESFATSAILAVDAPEPGPDALGLEIGSSARRAAAARRRGPNASIVASCHCGTTFTGKYSYDNHLKIHERKLKYACSASGCTSRFNTRGNLTSHERRCRRVLIEKLSRPGPSTA